MAISDNSMRVGVVAYGLNAFLVLPLSSDKGSVTNTLLPTTENQNIDTDYTNTAQGIYTATQELKQNGRIGATKVLILITDNTCNFDPEERGVSVSCADMQAIADATQDAGIISFVVGLTDAYNENSELIYLTNNVATWASGRGNYSINGVNVTTLYLYHIGNCMAIINNRQICQYDVHRIDLPGRFLQMRHLVSRDVLCISLCVSRDQTSHQNSYSERFMMPGAKMYANLLNVVSQVCEVGSSTFCQMNI
jgi:hypothetical protein